MKKLIFIPILLILSVHLFAQEQHEVLVVNIEVPVRVMDGNLFVNNLSPQDFEIYEDGQLQDLKSFYLVKNTKLQKQEGSSWSTPNTARRFFMLFQFLDYNPQLNDAIDYFFKNVLLPDDTLTVITPLKRYTLPREALETKTREQISKELQNLVRKDTKIGAGDYNSLLNDLKKIVRSISGTPMTGMESDSGSGFGLEFQLPRYKDTLQRLDEIRIVDQRKFLIFASQMKRMKGQKIVFFFYQREFRPEIDPRILNQLMSLYQDQPNIIGQVQDLFTMYNRATRMDVTQISQAFSDASVMFNFIFMHKEPQDIRGIKMHEQSEDVFDTFVQVADSSGGIIDNSQNPSDGFKLAANACQEYYLLVYNPKNYQKDGKFKNITIIVKNKNYKVSYRKGYYAN